MLDVSLMYGIQSAKNLSVNSVTSLHQSGQRQALGNHTIYHEKIQIFDSMPKYMSALAAPRGKTVTAGFMCVCVNVNLSHVSSVLKNCKINMVQFTWILQCDAIFTIKEFYKW